MSGKNQAHKGKSYGRMQWKSYQAVAWGYAQPIGNRQSDTEEGSECGTYEMSAQERNRASSNEGSTSRRGLEAEVKGFA